MYVIAILEDPTYPWYNRPIRVADTHAQLHQGTIRNYLEPEKTGNDLYEIEILLEDGSTHWATLDPENGHVIGKI